jgi:uncharacterized protein
VIIVADQPEIQVQQVAVPLHQAPDIVHFHPWPSIREDLDASRIPANWLLSGEPGTRHKLLGKTKDKLTYFMVWECGAATFQWHYGKDEFLTIVSGEAYLIEPDGAERHFKVADTAFFPAGSRATWRVPNHLRKIAVLKPSISSPFAFVSRAWMKFLLISGIAKQPGL